MNWVTMLQKLLFGLTPEIRDELSASLDRMAAKAKQTKLPFDDVAVGLLRMFTGL